MGKMKIWYDEERNYLEIRTEDEKVHMKDLGDDIWERVDESFHSDRALVPTKVTG